MGITLTYPISAPPIYYELSENFTSSGRRKAVRTKMGKPQFHKTSMQRLNDRVYQRVLNARKEMVAPKAKMRTNFDKFCDLYPQWVLANFAEFLLEFDQCDEDRDALLSYEEACRALDKLGDETSSQERQQIYEQAAKESEHNGKLDFEDFLSFCNTLFTIAMQDERAKYDYSSDEDSTIKQAYKEYYQTNKKPSSTFPTELDNNCDIKPSTSSHFRAKAALDLLPSTSVDLNETSFTDLNLVTSTESLPSSPSDPWVPMLPVHGKRKNKSERATNRCLGSQKTQEGCSCLLASSDSDEELIIVHQGIT